jgi:hypothetical protein
VLDEEKKKMEEKEKGEGVRVRRETERGGCVGREGEKEKE